MSERKFNYERRSLGESPKSVRISSEEMHLAYLHREATGEPIQSWIRRLIRENWDSRDLEPQDLTRRGSERLLTEELLGVEALRPHDQLRAKTNGYQAGVRLPIDDQVVLRRPIGRAEVNEVLDAPAYDSGPLH